VIEITTRRLVVLLLAILAHAPVGSAQTETDPNKAMELFQEARDAFDKGDHKTSVRKLRQALKLVDDAPTQAKLKITIARRLLDLDQPLEALKELQSIDKKRLRRSRKLRRVVEDDIQKIQALLQNPVQVVFETLPSGASIRLNADSPKKTPLAMKLPRGDVKIVIGLPGYDTVRERLNIKGTRTMRRRWTLQKQMSKLTVKLMNVPSWDDAPEALVTLDGKPIVAGEALEVMPGKLQVRCTFPEHPSPTNLTVNVPPGKDATVRCSLPEPVNKPGDWKTPVGWASIGGGTAAVAAGIGLLASWAVETSDYPSPQYEVKSSKPLAGGIVTGLGAGLLGLGTYLLLAD